MTSLTAWRGRAIEEVSGALYERHPELTARFGARGLKSCRDDIDHHLDHLEGALHAREAELFTNYAIWLKDVLTSRQVPMVHLAESFDLLSAFLSRHLPAEEAGRAREFLRAACDCLDRDDLPDPHVHVRVPAHVNSSRYREVALSGDHREAHGLMSRAMEEGHSVCEASVRLIQPAMYEVGRLWQQNRVSVAQEHLATAITQNVLARAHLQTDVATRVGRKAMFAAIAGNQHSIGLRILSDAFDTIGWDVSHLGADVPISDLISQVDIDRPELICLSLSLPIHLAIARETAERLRAELGTRCPTIWVGGQATLGVARVWKSSGADGWAADAMHALEQTTGTR